MANGLACVTSMAEPKEQARASTKLGIKDRLDEEEHEDNRRDNRGISPQSNRTSPALKGTARDYVPTSGTQEPVIAIGVPEMNNPFQKSVDC
ncbi:hypothetical protein FRC18_009141 [Serendipita sp. 400]|nr:hypothetical protein FRC18_009141 [Serendipita sp. 400]